MDSLHAMVSNRVGTGLNTGNEIATKGATVLLGKSTFTCKDGACASNSNMLEIDNIFISVQCFKDDTSCIIDGREKQTLIRIWREDQGTSKIQGIMFTGGRAGSGTSGGALAVRNPAVYVEVTFCVFTNCVSSDGGGAIYVARSSRLTTFSTVFHNNVASNGRGDDILAETWAIISINETCPEPNEDRTIPRQGAPLKVRPRKSETTGRSIDHRHWHLPSF